MSVNLLGALSLGIFFILMIASVRLWIPQRLVTLQSMLLVGALLLIALALAFGVPVRPPVLLTTTTLNPITATIAGFMLAGAVEKAGGFAAAGNLLVRLSRSFLGLSGTIILLVNCPTILAMPCGRIWAAALIPTALMFGFELARRHGDPALLPIIVFGLITNAAASCGPSPLGGIGMMGEGMGGFLPGSFIKPQQLAIMGMTLVTMAAMGLWHGIEVEPSVLQTSHTHREKLPASAYFSFLFLSLGLVAVFLLKPAVPIQTVLVGMTLVVMIVGKVGVTDLLVGVNLHPLTAMIAGFVMAGALLITGAFDTLVFVLSWLASHTPLGFVGVSILLIYLPLIFPMPCGRVLVAALLPGVIMFGQKVVEITNYPKAFSGLLISFILCCAASCATSPLGGIGSIGEGNLGIKQGVAAKPVQLGILVGVPLAALIAVFLGLLEESTVMDEVLVPGGLGLLFGVVMNLLLGDAFYKPGGLAGGILSALLMRLV